MRVYDPDRVEKVSFGSGVGTGPGGGSLGSGYGEGVGTCRGDGSGYADFYCGSPEGECSVAKKPSLASVP